MTLVPAFARIGRALVGLAPRPYRHDADHLLEILQDVCTAAERQRGALGVLAIGIRELADIARTVVRLHFGRQPVLTEAGPPPPRQPSSGAGRMLLDDLRHAIRRLRATPGTATLVMLMLALAIGITSAMFTVADHMLIRPAPFRDPARLVGIWTGQDPKKGRPYLQPALIRALRSSGAFSDVHTLVQNAVFVEGSQGLATRGAYSVTPGVFEMLGVSPLLGRTFVAGEGRPGTDDRAIIAEGVWRVDFNADPEIVGRRISISGTPATVVGVMPEKFRFPSQNTRIWRPYDLDAPPPRIKGSIQAFARLKDGFPEADAVRLASNAAGSAPVTPAMTAVHFRSVTAGFLDDYSKTAIRVLAAGVGLVFLVLCANVANLILARTTARRQEFGVCSALGASRIRLIRQTFLENIVMGVVALAMGLAAGAGLVSLARSSLPEGFLLRTLNPVELDVRAVAASSLLGLLAIVAAGLPAAWIGTAANAADSMRLASRGASESRGARAWTRLLLVGEVGLASALLVGAGVLVTSFVRLSTVDSGLNLRGVTTMWISLPEVYFKDRPARAAFVEDLRTELRRLPGVQAISLSYGLPPDGGGFSWGPLDTDGVAAPGRQTTVFSSSVELDFFQVYGITLLQGRNFRPDDGPDQVIVSEKLAQALWPGVSPLGRTFKFREWKEWMTVIGVAREVRSMLTDPREDLPEYYQRLSGAGGNQIMLGMRCDPSCPDEPMIRDRVRATSPQAMVHQLQPLETAYREQFARPRAAAGLAFAFASVSMLAAAGGLFSVLTYAVGRRRREFGIRAAMGAQPRQLRSLVFRDGMLVSAAGMATGAALTWALSRTLEALAFGVSASSPIVWIVVGSVIATATLFAAWHPAVEAMRADPVALLRDT
jgi:putative ABC transport system permease protein